MKGVRRPERYTWKEGDIEFIEREENEDGLVIKWGDSWIGQLRDGLGRWTDTGGTPLLGSKSEMRSESVSTKSTTTRPRRRSRRNAYPSRYKLPSVIVPGEETPAPKKPTTPLVTGRPIGVKQEPSKTKAKVDPDEAADKYGTMAGKVLSRRQTREAMSAVRKMTDVYGRPMRVTKIGTVEDDRLTFGESTEAALKSAGEVNAYAYGYSRIFYSRVNVGNIYYEQRHKRGVDSGLYTDTGESAMVYLTSHEYAHTLQHGLDEDEEEKFYALLERKLGTSVDRYVKDNKNKKIVLEISEYAATGDRKNYMPEFVAESLTLHAYKPGKSRLADTVAEAFMEATS